MKIAVTGGIGSGKSTVSKSLVQKFGDEDHDFQYINVDNIVRELYNDIKIKQKLFDIFGTQDRSVLSTMAFGDTPLRNRLEYFFSPYIKVEIDKLFDSKYSNVVVEFPLLFEKGQDYISKFDYVVTVVSPVKTRIERLVIRDGKTEEAIKKIMAAQTNDDVRIKGSDFVIYNNNIPFEDDVNDIVNRILNYSDDFYFPTKSSHQNKVGIISGSFDPITLGHTWVIQKALDIVDNVIIAIAHNPSKKYLFSQKERMSLVEESLIELLSKDQMSRVKIEFIPNEELTVSFAADHCAKFIFRGIRGFTDFEYENQLNLVQSKLAPDIDTIFLMPPRELIEVSSSLIKNSLHLREWERLAKPYISSCVFNKLQKLKELNNSLLF